MDDPAYESPSLAEILEDQGAAQEGPTEDPWADWPTVTAEAISLLNIHDCAEQLAQAASNPLRLAQAAKSAHLALQAALTAALAGSMGIGAYNKKLELRWLAYLQDGAEQPGSWRVMDFDGLLAKARAKKLEWTGRPLDVDDLAAAQLLKLTRIRHGIEHPKPGFWVIQPEYIHDVIPVAVRLAMELLRSVHHHFEPFEMEGAEAAVESIERACRPG